MICIKTKAIFIYFYLVINLVYGDPKLVLNRRDSEESVTITGEHCGPSVHFTESYDFSCVCLTGLWAFYERSCEPATALIGGSNGQCIPIEFKIRQVHRLSPPEDTNLTSSAALFDRDLTSVGQRFTSIQSAIRKTHFVPPGFPLVITTGRQTWRLPAHNKCLKPEYRSDTAHFCRFNHNLGGEYSLQDVGCLKDDEIISPVKCYPYLKDEDYEQSMDPRTCDHNIQKRTRVRRRADPSVRGRMFLAANDLGDNAAPESQNLTKEDENHELKPMIEQPILNSEIWNYMTTRAQERLGIRDHRVTSNTDKSYSPAFSFLNLAKKIQQKYCPDHYVRDEHYDVAVGAFLAIQRNHFKFADAFVDFPTSERIEEALNACLANISEPYPFVERSGYANVNQESSECNDSKPTTHGSYSKFDQILELQVRSDLASRANEPIVETVWKVFVHAHSACYPFFKDNYNDHHRFTTIMLNLFTNDIHDMWFNVTELQPDIYSGFLGDAVDLMDSVAYCSLFSRLESDYPWDLPRPKKYNARRKKRHVLLQREMTFTNYQCLEELDARNYCRVEAPTEELANDDGDGGNGDYPNDG